MYLDEGTPATANGRWRGWVKFICLSGAALLVLFAIYMAVRLTRDRPVEYADDVLHFEYGSTGGERTNGIPYWFWVALPELFPEHLLPDKTPGRGYSAFGMIYEPGKDPRYDLPVGMSMHAGFPRYRCGVSQLRLLSHRHGARCTRRGPTHRPGNAGPHVRPRCLGKFLTSVPTDQEVHPAASARPDMQDAGRSPSSSGQTGPDQQTDLQIPGSVSDAQ